jgi:hypothetical protein
MELGAFATARNLRLSDRVFAGLHSPSLSSGGKKHEQTQPVAKSPEKGDGARYRVRTCDPYRVKVVLYH